MPGVFKQLEGEPECADGWLLREVVKDAIAFLGAERIEGLEGRLVLWRVSGMSGSFQTKDLVLAAIDEIGKAELE